jgi:hypothetical protein
MVRISPTRADNDRGVLSYWHEWEIYGRDRRVVLCVETTLELRPGHPGFDAEQLDELIEHATALMHASGTPLDALRIMPAPAKADSSCR